MRRMVIKHARPLRWLHWINVPLLFGMIWSGLLIYWANDVYALRLGSWTIVSFFPEWFYETLGMGHRLAEGMAWHFSIMWLFVLNGLAYISYTIVSGEWRELFPRRSTLREAWQVVLHDLGLSRQELPVRKFNGAQQLAYTGVLLMGAGSVITGLEFTNQRSSHG